ncbi:MAG: HAD family hydrolase [Acidimicrobiales bacterium]
MVTRRSGYRLYPDALDVLSQFRSAGYLLGVVTNGPPDLQREKVETTGLNEYVDVVAVSGEVGTGISVDAVTDHHGGRGGDSDGRDTRWQPAVASLADLPSLLEIG